MVYEDGRHATFQFLLLIVHIIMRWTIMQIGNIYRSINLNKRFK